MTLRNSTPVQNFDARANAYALQCFCVTMAAFLFAWILNQLGVFIVDKHIMNLGLELGLGLFTVCLITCRVFSLKHPMIKYILLFFLIAISTVIEVMLTYHAVILSVFPIAYSAMYHDTKRMTVYTYLVSVISIVIIVFGGYYIGLCDANMALLTSEPLAAYISEGGQFTLNAVNPNPLVTLSLYFIFPRCVLCGLFVPVCINISGIIAESRLKEEEMRIMAEIDGMTGLYNKSKYLEMVSQPYTTEEQIAVIFWDINDLKRINDTYGHETGDQLIISITESIKKISSSSEKVYRIGGDEFVMILRGGSEASVSAKISEWRSILSGKTIGDGIPVSAAVGYACGSGKNLDALIKAADEMMYENKREYHKNH